MLAVGCGGADRSRSEGDLEAVASEAQQAIILVSDDQGEVVVSAGEVGGRPLEGDDVFLIGSATKMMTAVEVLRLADQGKIGLDDLLADYVEFEVATPITIRHLLQHTSGLNDSDSFYSCDLEEVMEGLASVAAQPVSEPGASALYSTNGFNMLSLVIASATGRDTNEVFREDLFEPLGMTSTYFTEAEAGPEDPDAVVVLDGIDENRPQPCPSDELAIGTGGGFASSVQDLDVFVRALFDGELLTETSLNAMTTVGSQVFGYDYGLGIGVLTFPVTGETPVYGHWGVFGWNAGVIYDPVRQRTVAALTPGGRFEHVVERAFEWAEDRPNR